jgi:hypothetical protein
MRNIMLICFIWGQKEDFYTVSHICLFGDLLSKAIEKLNIDQVRREVDPFVKNPEALKVWSKAFFQDVARRIVLI